MAYIVDSLADLIGNTPLLHLKRYEKEQEVKADIIAKLEHFNPGGSIKDRVAYAMIKAAEYEGKLTKKSVIVEATSGNTGIGLAVVSAIFGYSLTIVMPETMSIERQKLLKALGATIILTEGSKGMKGAIEKAKQLCEQNPDALMLEQFKNPANPSIHRLTTAVEIFDDTDGEVDIYVAGVGTGGTLTGVGEVLKEYNPNIKVVAVEPKTSPILSQGVSGSHKIQGIGAGFVPSILNKEMIDEIITVSNEDAIEIVKCLARTEGLLVGISSGAAIYAATELGKRKENEGKRIVVICPDTGERYLSTGLFD
ncbi:MAG: cysteine synthase A [Turicibacter sp.]|nr:cysteine synthase A [Turicibacter sp.]